MGTWVTPVVGGGGKERTPFGLRQGGDRPGWRGPVGARTAQGGRAGRGREGHRDQTALGMDEESRNATRQEGDW